MISYLSGIVTSIGLDSAVVDVGGVGYGVRLSSSDTSKLEANSKTKLFIYEHIREDAHDLFGFINETSRELFEQLLSVKNVGPKVALAVLCIGSEGSIRSAIAGGEVKTLQGAKGVGKRAAEQIVVELRDKVGLVASADAEGIVYRSAIDESDEALQALIELGYSQADATSALAKVDKTLSTEDRVRQVLKGGN